MKSILTIALAIISSSAFAFQLSEVNLVGYIDVMEKQCDQVVELARSTALVTIRDTIISEKKKKNIDVSDEEFAILTSEIYKNLSSQINGNLVGLDNLTNNWVTEDQYSAECSVMYNEVE